MDTKLTPISESEFAAEIARQLPVIRARKEITKNSGDTALAYALVRRLGDQLDYAKAVFGDSLSLSWAVVETAAQVEQGKKIGNPAVQFVASLDDLPWQPDVAIFSGVLQYLPDDPFAFLGHAAVAAAGHVMVMRTPLGEREIPYVQSVTYSHRSPARLAGRVLRKTDLLTAMAGTHDLIASWEASHDMGRWIRRIEETSMLWRAR